MPELPEVETIVRDLNKTLLRKIFSEIIVHDTFVLRQGKTEFVRRLKGRSIERIIRRGKAVVMELSSREFLVVQVMMTGQLVVGLPADRHTRVIFKLSDGTDLLYNDQRRFGQLKVVKNLQEINYFNILGPEPFSKEFSADYLHKALKKTTRPIKNVLLDHTFVAGIGNIYACEILFRSGISPRRPARRINAAEAVVIRRQIIEVLKEAITFRGSSMRNYRDGAGQKGAFNRRLVVYAREDESCPRCETKIKRIIQSARSTFYCAVCQK